MNRDEMLSPWSWAEILDKFPLDYWNWQKVSGPVPEGHLVRELDDKAGQYGDLLQHGITYVCKPGNVVFFSGCSASSTTSYTVAAVTASSGSFTVPVR